MKRQIRCLGSGWRWYVRAAEHVKAVFILAKNEPTPQCEGGRLSSKIMSGVCRVFCWRWCLGLWQLLSGCSRMAPAGFRWPMSCTMWMVSLPTVDRPTPCNTWNGTWTFQYFLSCQVPWIYANLFAWCNDVIVSALLPSCLAWQCHVWDLWRR